MDWAETRQAARRVVHDTFRLPAVYTSRAGVVTPCFVRMHNEMKSFGDLDREGFAQREEEINRIIFDSVEVVPEKGAVVDVTGFAIFNIVNILPETTNGFIRTEVTLV